MQRRQILKSLVLAGGAGFVTSGKSLLAGDTVPPSSNNRNRVARFAHLTDIHINANRSAPIGLATALQHVQSLEDRPEFIINGGDAIYDALAVDRSVLEQQWKLWNTVWRGKLFASETLSRQS